MATTAPGTRFAAISRAKKSSIRASPCCEKPTSSGFASGSGPALAALKAMANSAALTTSFFTGASRSIVSRTQLVALFFTTALWRRRRGRVKRFRRPALSPRPRQGFRRRLAKLFPIGLREIAEMPEAIGQRGRLDAFRAGNQPPPHQPQPAQTKIAVQAHAAIALHGIVHRAHRNPDARRQFLAVDD